MKRKIISMLIIMLILLSSNVYADEWKSDTHGKWYEHSDGSYTINNWEKIDDKYYYFNEYGYALRDTGTPDGYYVDDNGAWVEDIGKKQSRFNGVVTKLTYPGGGSKDVSIPVSVSYEPEYEGNYFLNYSIDRIGCLVRNISCKETPKEYPDCFFGLKKNLKEVIMIIYSDGSIKFDSEKLSLLGENEVLQLSIPKGKTISKINIDVLYE